MKTRRVRASASATVSLTLLGLVALQACGSNAPASNGGGAGANSSAGSGTAGSAAAGSAGLASAGSGGSGVSGGGSGNAAGSPGAAGAGVSGGGTGGGGTGGSAGAPAAGGAAGSGGPDKCEVPPDGSLRKAPAFPPTAIPNPTGILFRFMNNCPMKLWVNTSNPTYAFPGGPVALNPKAVTEFDMPNGVSQRVQTWKGAAPGQAGSIQIQFMEMNAAKGQALNYNLSGVDWVGLPVEIKGIGTAADCGVTGCYKPLADLLTGCPAQLLDTTKGECVAPYHYCADSQHATEAFCTVLNAAAADIRANDPDCKAAGGTNTPGDLFGCAGGFWGANAACCAKLHRGVTGVNASAARDNCAYYKNPPYDVYSAWSHKQCPFIYAFAYDDFHEQSGFHTCTKGTELDITYCPGDAP